MPGDSSMNICIARSNCLSLILVISDSASICREVMSLVLPGARSAGVKVLDGDIGAPPLKFDNMR